MPPTPRAVQMSQYGDFALPRPSAVLRSSWGKAVGPAQGQRSGDGSARSSKTYVFLKVSKGFSLLAPGALNTYLWGLRPQPPTPKYKGWAAISEGYSRSPWSPKRRGGKRG